MDLYHDIDVVIEICDWGRKDERYIFIPTNFSEFKSDTVPDIVLV